MQALTCGNDEVNNDTKAALNQHEEETITYWSDATEVCWSDSEIQIGDAILIAEGTGNLQI